MLPYIAIFAEIISILGAGATLLRIFKINKSGSFTLDLSIAFALGTGILGWILFWFAFWGIINFGTISILMAILCALFIYEFRSIAHPNNITRDFALLIALFVLIIMAGAIISYAPPSDADSLSYHFAIPLQFIKDGQISFIPRAVDGAIPLLIQMTYIPALCIGGESAMTLFGYSQAIWAFVFIYSLSRQYISRNLSLCITIVIATTPAILPNSTSGQVETKIILFVLLAVWGVIQAVRTTSIEDRFKFSLIAGLGAGFYAASKYLGLFFIVSCGIALLVYWRGYRHIIIFSIAAIVSGFQWYFWNWLNTGDPVFPMLFNAIKYSNDLLWNKEQHELFLHYRYSSAEIPAKISLWLWLIYPIKATLWGLSEWESGRTGLGVLPLLLAPFAIMTLARNYRNVVTSNLSIYTIIIITFYTLMIFIGSSQRVRHFIPVLPLILITFVYLSQEFSKALYLSLLLVISFQVMVLLIFAAPSIRYALGNETKEEFLEHSIPHYNNIRMLNNILSNIPDSKVLHQQRYLAYYLNIPAIHGHGYALAIIPPYEANSSSRNFLQALKREKITHVLITDDTPQLDPRYRELIDKSALLEINRWQSHGLNSRTLGGTGSQTTNILLKVTENP